MEERSRLTLRKQVLSCRRENIFPIHIIISKLTFNTDHHLITSKTYTYWNNHTMHGYIYD